MVRGRGEGDQWYVEGMRMVRGCGRGEGGEGRGSGRGRGRVVSGM